MLDIHGYTVVIARYQDVRYLAEILELGETFIDYTYDTVYRQALEYIELLNEITEE